MNMRLPRKFSILPSSETGSHDSRMTKHLRMGSLLLTRLANSVRAIYQTSALFKSTEPLPRVDCSSVPIWAQLVSAKPEAGSHFLKRECMYSKSSLHTVHSVWK